MGHCPVHTVCRASKQAPLRVSEVRGRPCLEVLAREMELLWERPGLIVSKHDLPPPLSNKRSSWWRPGWGLPQRSREEKAREKVAQKELSSQHLENSVSVLSFLLMTVHSVRHKLNVKGAVIRVTMNYSSYVWTWEIQIKCALFPGRAFTHVISFQHSKKAAQ